MKQTCKIEAFYTFLDMKSALNFLNYICISDPKESPFKYIMT